jgi:hypothetical protein
MRSLICVAGVFLVMGYLEQDWNKAIVLQFVAILFVGLIAVMEYTIPASRKRKSNAKKRAKRKKKK